MRKWIWTISALVAVVAPVSGGVLTGVSQAADDTVTVNDAEFAPAELTVAPGTKVVWQNTSQNAPHSAKAQDGSFDTGYIMPGQQGEATFSQPGDFQYFCEPHPWKKGVIHVK